MFERKNVPVYIKTDPKTNRIITLAPIRYKNVYVPAGYSSDGLTKLINKYQPRCLRAAIVHDFICETKCLSRKIGDQYFHEIMLLDSVRKFKARGLWLGVRAYAIAFFKR